MKQLSFAQERLFQEFKLRGQVMTMCVDMEMILLRIILYCLVQTPNDTLKDFKKMVLETKISKAKKYLKMIHPILYEENLSAFKSMASISKFRNKFAHSTMTWNEKTKDISYFYLTIIADIKKQERFQLVKITIIEYKKRIETIRKVGIQLDKLADKIQDDYNYKYPNFFNPSIA